MKLSKIIRDIQDLLGQEKKDYYKQVRLGNFRSRNHISYEGNYQNKILSIKEYLNKIRLHLIDIIYDLKKSKKFDTWEIQLTIAIFLYLPKTLMKSV